MILSEAVPVWAVIGVLAVCGWAIERYASRSADESARELKHDLAITVLETRSERAMIDLESSMKSIAKIEQFADSRPTEKVLARAVEQVQDTNRHVGETNKILLRLEGYLMNRDVRILKDIEIRNN